MVSALVNKGVSRPEAASRPLPLAAVLIWWRKLSKAGQWRAAPDTGRPRSAFLKAPVFTTLLTEKYRK